MKKFGDFMLGVFGLCIFAFALVMGFVIFGLALSLFFALLPYLILGYLVAWVIKAFNS